MAKRDVAIAKRRPRDLPRRDHRNAGAGTGAHDLTGPQVDALAGQPRQRFQGMTEHVAAAAAADRHRVDVRSDADLGEAPRRRWPERWTEHEPVVKPKSAAARRASPIAAKR